MNGRWTLAAAAGLVAVTVAYPGAELAFGLGPWHRLTAIALWLGLHGAAAAATGRTRDALSVAALASGGAAALASSGAVPLSWALVYLGVPLVALRHGLAPVHLVTTAIVAAGAALGRYAVEPVPVALTLAHATFPTVLFVAFAGHAEASRRVEAEVTALIEAGEAARAAATRLRLAQDVHDGVGALLTAAILRGEVTALAASRDDPAAVASLARAGHLVRQARAELAALDPAIRSAPQRFCASLRSLAEDLVGASGATLDARLRLEERDRIGPSESLALRQVVRELLTNVARHARAERVELDVWTEAGWLCGRVTDDGIGCGKRQGFGRDGVVRRLHEMGGHAAWRPGARGGTVVDVRLPLGGPRA